MRIMQMGTAGGERLVVHILMQGVSAAKGLPAKPNKQHMLTERMRTVGHPGELWANPHAECALFADAQRTFHRSKAQPVRATRLSSRIKSAPLIKSSRATCSDLLRH